MLPVHVVDVLDQLVPAGEHRPGGPHEPHQILLRGADLPPGLELDPGSVVVCVLAAAVVGTEVLVLLRVVAYW